MKIVRPIFFLSVIILSCEKESDVERDPTKIITNLTVSKDIIEADGASDVEITAELPEEATDSNSVVVFKTNAGHFVDTGTDANTLKLSKLATLKLINGKRSRYAVARLVSEQTIKTATVTAQVLTYERPVSIKFVNAPPNTISLSSNSTKIQPNLASEVTFNVYLKRDVGIPSIGTPVSITVTGDDGKEKGNFREKNNKSNAAGQCSFIYNIPDSYVGQLKAVAMVLGENGAIKKDSVFIYSSKQ